MKENTTYYYQVCGSNSAGSDCKAGSIKTAMRIGSIKVGDYVSMTPTATSYTPPSSITGYAGLQNTLNPSELNLWRVIKVNDDGTVEMVSDNVSSKNIIFYGEVGYMNLVGGLNQIATQYTNSKYVSKTRHIGYSIQKEVITEINTSLWGESCHEWTCTCSGFTEVEEAQGAGDIGYTTDYQLVNGVYGNMIGKNPSGTATTYWLASRYSSRFNAISYTFGGNYVSTSGSLDIASLYSYRSGLQNSSCSYAVRPIVTIKSSVEISGGNGTKNFAYQLK